MRFGTCNTCGSDFPILELFAHVYACRAQHDADAEEAPLLRAKLAEARALLEEMAAPYIDATDWYEKRAMEFYRETRLMAPGKSAPLGMYSESDDQRRREEWDRWNNEKAKAMQKRLIDFLAANPGTEAKR